MSEHQIGDRCGAGIQLFFSTLKWYGYLFWTVSLIYAWPIYSNAHEGDIYGALYNMSAGDTYLTRLSFGVQRENTDNRVSQASAHVLASTLILIFINWLAGRNEKKVSPSSDADRYMLTLVLT